MEELLLRIKKAVMAGEEDEVKELLERGLGRGMEPRRLLEEGMMPAMEEIGRLFSQGEAFIPELLVAAYAMEAGLEVLKPYLGGEMRGRGLVVLGTVQGDIHSIGKNLVRMCLEGAGFEVVDIGEDVKKEKFVEAYKEFKPQIMGLSALLSSTMQNMQPVIQALREVDPEALVMVGGAPITQEFADQIGASGYAPNAFEAALKAKELVERRG